MKKTLILLAMTLTGMAAHAQAAADSLRQQGQTQQPSNENNQIMEKEKLTVLESIANGVKDGYLHIENGVVKGYKTIENGIVKGFTSVNDTLTVKLFGKQGETLEDTKARLQARINAQPAEDNPIVQESLKATQERVKEAREKAGQEKKEAE